MLRIVGVQKDANPDKEFVLLQNQGSLKVNLRGHVVMSEAAMVSGSLYSTSHVFTEEVSIPPGQFVIAVSGTGESRWKRTKDGGNVFHAYLNQDSPIWIRLSGPIHVLSTTHTYADRPVDHLLLR